MTDIVKIIRTQAEEQDESSHTSKFYIPQDQRTIGMEHALAAADEIDRLRSVVKTLGEMLAVGSLLSSK